MRFESPLHAGLQVAGDREPKEIREQFKAWCTRRLKALQQERLRPLSAHDSSAAAIRQKWWAERGSALYVNDEEGLEAVIHYVREAQDHADQPQPQGLRTRISRLGTLGKLGLPLLYSQAGEESNAFCSIDRQDHTTSSGTSAP